MTSKEKLKQFILDNSEKYTIEEFTNLTKLDGSTIRRYLKKGGKSYKTKHDKAWEDLAKQIKLK